MAEIHIVVFWVMILCSPVCGYQCFKGRCCLHLRMEMKMQMVWLSKTLVLTY